MLAQQRSALTFGHASPDPELNAIVECICTTLELDWAMTADRRSLALGGSTDEQLVRIDLAAPCPGHPGQSCFVLYRRSCRFCHYDPLSEAQY